MALIFYTDPHIGVNRTGNTTPASREKLKESINNTVGKILGRRQEGDYLICLGDLFDTYSNPESVIRQGSTIVEMTDLILAGNHDVVADADKVGSLELIMGHHPSKVIYAPFNEPHCDVRTFDGVAVVAVPHVTTQDLFEESLSIAIEKAELMTGMQRMLCLHCNYDSPHELTETSLNLTPERVQQLLGSFNYVLLGHEHQPRDLFGGRLIILGNTHPTGFSDISPKRIAILDDKVLHFEEVWSEHEGYGEFYSDDLPALHATLNQFVRIKGSVSSDQMAGVSKAISTLWKTSPNLLAMKSEVTVSDVPQQEADQGEMTPETLPALIERELESDPAMQSMWKEFTT